MSNAPRDRRGTGIATLRETAARPTRRGDARAPRRFLRVAEHAASASDARDTVRKETGSIIKTGYLEKLGGNKQGAAGNWKRRFMVLSDNLEYYESEEKYQNGAAPKNKVSMNATYCPTPVPNEKNQFSLFALPFEFAVRADSKEDMDEWVHIFQNIQSM